MQDINVLEIRDQLYNLLIHTKPELEGNTTEYI